MAIRPQGDQMIRLKAFAARNVVPLTILIAVLAMALGGIISWTNFGIFAVGWLLGMGLFYLKTS